MNPPIHSLLTTRCQILLLGFMLAAPQPPPSSPRIATVVDSGSPTLQRLAEAVRDELGERRRLPVEWLPVSTGDNSLETARLLLENASAAADIVLAIGPVTTLAATTTLPSPVVGGFLQDAEMIGVMWDELGRSPYEHLALAVARGRVRRDLQAFHRLVPFSRVHAVVDRALAEEIPELTQRVLEAARSEEFSVEVVAAADAKAIEQLDAEALYLGILPWLQGTARSELFEQLADRSIPVFSARGAPDVEAGALAALLPEAEDQLARRLAQHLDGILRGARISELPAYLPLRQQPVLSGRTAAKLGLEPDLEILLAADILHPEALRRGRPLSLTDAIRLALEGNVDLQIQEGEVRAAAARKKSAIGTLLPQLDATSGYTQVDSETAAASGGLLAENETTVGLEATQILFDDGALTASRVAGRNARAAEHQRDAIRLDTAAAAAGAYLSWLQANVLTAIEIDNLKVTRSNLETSQARFRVGSGGSEELLRWEAEEARQQSSLLAARATVEQARVALNRELGTPLDELWQVATEPLSDARWEQVVPASEALDRFVVGTAFERSPNLKELDMFVESGRLAVGRQQRAFFVPSLFASYSFQRIVDEKLATASPPPLRNPEKDSWSLALRASFPLFSGTSRWHDLAEARAELGAALASREQVRQLVEQRARVALAAVRASYPAIELQLLAAERMRQTFEILQNRYAAGRASLLELLEAQNQAFSLRLQAEISKYDYLADLTELQRSISLFEVLESPESMDLWFTELRQAAKDGS